uniref:CSON007219 protein n=1 Tax=Culicoides sonorensis TaxID=179676 RepID=A0A336MZ84_CULSO
MEAGLQVLQNPSLVESTNNDNIKAITTSNEIDSPSYGATTDSGVETMSCELNESMVSSGCFEADAFLSSTTVLPDLLIPASEQLITTRNDLDGNSNVDTEKISDEMISSVHSTFDSEIVYRRRKQKTPTKKAPKKRVSFHEDILNNKKTDNIRIEHGFVAYKGGFSKKQMMLTKNSRYSWCSEYGSGQTEMDDDEDSDAQPIYRNACSDVLDFGKTEVFDTEEEKLNCMKYNDNSGVFEYYTMQHKKNRNQFNQLYKCDCSSSNSSLASDDSDPNANNKRNYAQAKSNSCECIGSNQRNNNVISDNCYYSEPNIMDEYNQNDRPKHSWSKEKKPKSSCLKKTKYTVNNMVMPEYNLNRKMQKFNVHHLTTDVTNQILDNSKTLIGSLKDIFGITLPERGVPEGSEDLQPVAECVAETPDDNFQVIQKPKAFLSKSLEGVNRKNTTKTYVHNVDEQLRGKNDEDLYAPTRKNSIKNEDDDNEEEKPEIISTETEPYRNKYIINCESTVFEHTGVSFVYDQQQALGLTPAEEQKPPASTLQKLSNIFKTGVFSNNSSAATSPTGSETDKKIIVKTPTPTDDTNRNVDPKINQTMESSMTSSCSAISETVSTSTNTTTTKDTSQADSKYPTATRTVTSPKRHGRHIASPMRQKTQTIARIMSPDLFNPGNARNTMLSDEFDDILTITTTSDQTDKIDDMVIVDYQSVNDKAVNDYIPSSSSTNQYLRPVMSSSSSKSSLINRFLRNVTQKKILEATIKKNPFFQTKLKSESKLFGNLYVKPPKKCNKDMIEDMNAEIAMEIEENVNEKKRLSTVMSPDEVVEAGQFEGGVGELSIELFHGKILNILRNDTEILMKAFKLYTGYSREGYLTPVLVFLTDKTIYVTNSQRNRLINKFVLPYIELDCILMGPFGNTVLLSNSARDMQQVLLAGGPYPADGLVASLELCARKGGSSLPAIGQLTLDHLAPLQAFVRDNSSVAKSDTFKYYSVVNVPAGSLSDEKEPLGPYLKGFLMHRTVSHSGAMQQWSVGYFLLKAGVLYLFNDSNQKLPTWAVCAKECQGARRALNTGRPHTFELLLRTGSLQLAAPDEYVASEWLQALVQAASGLFEMQDRHKSLGCTLIMTNNHLITLREDFASPLRRNSSVTPSASTMLSPPLKENIDPNLSKKITSLTTSRLMDDCSEISSIRSIPSTPSRQFSDRKSNNSNISTPTKVGSMGKSTSGMIFNDDKSHTNMTSFYGKNSGVEILTCAAIDDMISIKVPSESNELWCIVEFSCQEVRETSDDLTEEFPLSILSEDDPLADHCSRLFRDINKSWELLVAAAFGYPY